MIIAIDGYAATGKSTLSRMLSKKIGFQHINSGFFYRAISHYLLSNEITVRNYKEKLDIIENLVKHFNSDSYELGPNSQRLRSPKVSELGMHVAKLPFIRERVNAILREIAQKSNVIAEGRDIGTVLFPNADIKFFFVADIEVRVKRLERERNTDDPETLRQELKNRDYEDTKRKISPLKKAPDAIEIDTSYLTVDDILNLLEQYLNDIRK